MLDVSLGTPEAASAADEPLRLHRAFASNDIKSFRQYLAHSYCDHHVQQLNRGAPADARHNRVALSEMSLNYLAYGADVEIDIGPFETFYMLEVPQSGRVNLSCGSHRLVTKPGLAAVISPTLPVYSNWSADCAQIMVKIARSALEQHLANLIGRSLPHELVFDPAMDLQSCEAQSLMNFCSFMFDQYAGSPGSLTSRMVTKDLEHAFMSALLLCQPNNYSEQIRARSSPVAPRHIRKAIQFIEANLHEQISFSAMLEAAGVSARAFYAGFNRFVGMPPQTYIKNLRLDRAQEELAACDGRSTVAEIAMRWHFNHLGRFSSEYRKKFGESPRDTLRR
jgi:AraC-like DNA-binding protein